MHFSVASSPHSVSASNMSQMMRNVVLCTLPGVATLCYFFGLGSLIQIALATASAMLAEALILRLRNRSPKPILADNSALLTGVLLGIALPPLAPWWLAVIGASFAIIIAKQLYGGLGHNLFNPAMVGYVLLLISFPVAMTNWLPPSELIHHSLTFNDTLLAIFTGMTSEGFSVDQLRMGIDGVTMATPLDTLKTDLTLGLTSEESMTKAIYGDFAGLGWEWVNLAFLVGGLWLMKLKTIRWHIPVSMLASLLFFSLAGYLLDPDSHGTPIFHLFSGATMFGAFFIATDPVTAGTSNFGRLIFGALIGFLIYIIRSFGGYPDALAFAVLLANMAVPVIDYYTKPTTYGQRRG